MADVRTAMDVLNKGCREAGVCPERERYHAAPNEKAEIAHMSDVARRMEQRLLTEREEMIAERAAVQASELTAAKIAEQVAKELSGEVLHYSPVSEHCQAVLASPPPCTNFREIRSFVLCKAWDIMDKEKRTSLPVGEAWAEARRVCRTE